jgi:hypothetical protein
MVSRGFEFPITDGAVLFKPPVYGTPVGYTNCSVIRVLAADHVPGPAFCVTITTILASVISKTSLVGI